MRQEVKILLVSSDSVDAAWRQLDVNNSKSVTTSEWQTWVKSRWAFVSNAAATQAYQRTLASMAIPRRENAPRNAYDVITRSHFDRLVQTLPICCEAEAMFLACDVDGDHRVSSTELKKHAKSYGMNLNADQVKIAVELFDRGARLSNFCDWYFQQKGGDTAQEIAAVRHGISCGVVEYLVT